MMADNHKAWAASPDNKYKFPETLTTQRLDKITAPALVVIGSIDLPDLIAIGKILDEKISNSELAMMDDASHHPNLEKSEEFNRILKKILRK